jgi:hypothetical protein
MPASVSASGHVALKAAARFGQALSYSPGLDHLLGSALAATPDHSTAFVDACQAQDGQAVVFCAYH